MKRFLTACLALGILLCGCGQAQNDAQDTTKDTSTALTSGAPTETTTADTTTKPPDMDRPSPSQQMEADGISYTLFEEIVLVGIQSDMEKVTIAAQLTRTDSTGEDAETINISKIYLCDPVFGISSVKELQLPRCRQLEIAEGYTQWEWTNDRVHAPQVQTLYLPSTMEQLLPDEQPKLLSLAEAHLAVAAVPYDPESRSVYGDGKKLSEYRSEKDFMTDQHYAAVRGLFTAWENLEYISVADGNKVFYDIDGVLYGNSEWNATSGDHLLYHPTLTEIPAVRLACLPQSYASDTGIYTVSDTTQYIHSGGIYCPKNIHTLVIPDSVVFLSPASIVATAEHPLTVVCSRNSVAAEYVERFGQMYHLTVEYAD